METRFKFLGHPVHPMLIVYPVGLLSAAVIADLLHLVTAIDELPVFAFYAIAIGVIGGVAAAAFGAIDWLALPKATRARRIGAIHGTGNIVVLALFALSFLRRAGADGYVPDAAALMLGLAGGGIALGTAWLGGELVYRLRVAVDDDAGLDATNSLRREGVVDVKG